MKKQLLLFFVTLIVFNCYSQATYEKGYYINNSGQKTEGLIKNFKWLNNPVSIQFKLTEDSDAQTLSIENIKEFRVYNYHKYERHTVDIDRSSDVLANLSSKRDVNFNSETLFLKVEIEGDANLYSYGDRSLSRFFLKTKITGVEQLIYKRYYVSNTRIGKNNQFQQQLFNVLKCKRITRKNIENTRYNLNSLINLILKYNRCSDSNFTYTNPKKVKTTYNLSLRAGTTFHSIETTDRLDYQFKTNTLGYRLGAEFEVTFGFVNGMWSIIAEPTYQFFKESNFESVSYRNFAGFFVINSTYQVEATYGSLEIPVGFRRYLINGLNSKLYLNAGVSFSFSSESLKFDGFKLKRNTTPYYAIGYKLNNKYNIELNYSSFSYTGDINREAKQNSFSIILGYKIF